MKRFWILSGLVLSLGLSSLAHAASTEHSAAGSLLIQLFFMVLAGQIGGWLLGRLGLPQVVGQVLAGVIIGPSLLNLAQVSDFNLALAELGAIFLLFMVGLETRLADLLKVGRSALLVALLGILFPMAFGYAFGYFQNYDTISSLFIGTALVATSVGITAKVLQELGVLHSRYAQVILGAAVIDDILGLTILAVVSSLGSGASFNGVAVLGTLGLSLGFVFAVLAIGVPLLQRLQPRLSHLSISNSFGWAISIGLGIAALALKAGLAPIIGAFLAGMVLAEVKDAYDFEHKVHALEAFLAPIFFVVVGMQLDIALLANSTVLIAGGILSLLAILGKFMGGALGAWDLGWQQARLIGVGMVPRGEVGLVVASIGLSLQIVDKSIYAQVLMMVIVTTLMAPIVLRMLITVPKSD